MQIKSRPMEFRVWQKEKKVYLTSNKLQTTDSVPVISHEMSFTLNDAFVIFEQWTGMVDRSDKKIFEGDLMRTPKGTVFQVVYSNKFARFYVRAINQWRSQTNPRTYVFKSLAYAQARADVVGTALANPELFNDGM